jgi:superfamily II DNA or RNA helicase
MQNLPDTHVGEVVSVRRQRWRVVDVRSFDACRIVTLSGVEPSNRTVERRVIEPFDVLRRVAKPSRLAFLGRGRWQGACRALIAGQASAGGLWTAVRAGMDLLPHQLEPALAVVQGRATRLLLADDVGLGKTVQAGLIVAELRARGAADRLLILTPPGLRDQWAAELLERFGIEAQVVEAAGLRRLACTLTVGANPWTAVPVAIASIDFVKRPEVLPAAAGAAWDVMIVDEAHGAVGSTDRHRAVATLAARAAYVVLLTATPHSGSRPAFESLASIGLLNDHDDPLVVFRRTRSEVRLDASRHVHRLRVRQGTYERRLHASLDRFAWAVRQQRGSGAALGLSVLYKRACSSAHALRCSVDRRLAALSTEFDAGCGQLALPMDDRGGELSTADLPPDWPPDLQLDDVGLEQRLLQAVSSAAATASTRESKIAALVRFVRRLREPVIVFTEYRDTLLHVGRRLDRALLLHGGLSRDERRAVLEAFGSRSQGILLATDAAGEGLNLHRTCRVVVNLELPWNPMRLEQRIGRVDRIGQRRRVHALHLIAADTREVHVLERLQARVARARADIGSPDPLGLEVEREIVRAVVGGIDADPMWAPDTTGGSGGLRVPIEAGQLRNEASAETVRLTFARACLRPGDTDALIRLEAGGGGVGRPNRWQTRQHLGRSGLLVWRSSLEDGSGRHVASIAIALRLPAPLPADDVLKSDGVRQLVENAAAEWKSAVEMAQARFVATRLVRERAMSLAESAGSALYQAGLFDRRGEASRAMALRSDLERHRDQLARIAALERSQRVIALPPELALVIV